MKAKLFALLFVLSAAHANEVAQSSNNTLGASAFTSISSALSQRSVADVEQMRDEYAQLSGDVDAGLVTEVEEIRQPTLKAWFLELQSTGEGAADLPALIEQAAEVLFN